MSSQSFATRVFNKSLDYIEIVGNKLPHPATLFGILALIVVFISWLGDLLGWQTIHPGDGSKIIVNSLVSSDGLRWIYTNLTYNFVNFPPLGYVLAVMIGIGVAEGSGLFNSMIRALVLNAPKKLITGTIVFAGIISHLASEAGYVILIPLGAVIFHTLGRHPMAGLAAAFCGVSGGFGANFLIGSVDPILAGLSQSAAQIIDKDISINAAANYYFMLASSFLIVVIGTWVTEKIVEPRLNTYNGTAVKIPIEEMLPIERKALRWAGVSLLVVIALLALSVVPENGLLRNPKTGEILHSPFFDGIITGILIFFLVPGLVYGIIVKSIKNDKDMMKHIIKSMGTLATYIVLVFFAAQFVYFFRYSNLGLIFAIQGANFLKEIGLTGIPLIVLFVLLSAFINMFMGSASAKWAIMAPVFVPMFMLLGYHPALTQAAFRIGDSVTNVITPMMSYFALIVTFAQKYDEKYGLGTIISTMIPYTIFFTIFWTLLLILWIFLGLPLGPDGPLYLK
ncbi:MAG: aminobenzoyl-glutamate transport protein [Ignavibacteria bacterium]|nr:MAG: aminobenzoyl-glutamate transport protein [Ignavibacteria bacterium]KAF0157444.1 MAG: aminobenzoyl-glutamate transport protein [Ignavibacteria bacterium]